MDKDRFPLDSAQLELLLAFEASEGLSELAKALHRDTSVVSRALQKLGTEAPVIAKKGGRWRLTPVGRQINHLTRRYLQEVRRLLPNCENELGELQASLQAGKARLVILNAQQTFQEPFWGTSSNEDAVENLRLLLQRWRLAQRPVIHVRHHSDDPTHPFYFDAAGARFIEALRPRPGERVVSKTMASAFGGTELEPELKREGVDTLVLTGFTASECIDATAKVAYELGFHAVVVPECIATFDIETKDGNKLPAREVQDFTLAVLGNGIASLVSKADLIAALDGRRR